MLQETNINNFNPKTKLFLVPKKKDTISSAHINGDWGDIVTNYKNGKTINYTEEIDVTDSMESDGSNHKKVAA